MWESHSAYVRGHVVRSRYFPVILFVILCAVDRRACSRAACPPDARAQYTRQYPSSIAAIGPDRAASEWTDIKRTYIVVGLIAPIARELHYTLFTNEHYVVTRDAHSLNTALYVAGSAR